MTGFEIVLVILVLFAVAVVAVAWIAGNMRKMAQVAAGAAPYRVNPIPEPEPRWRNTRKIEDLAEEYRLLGFQEIGAFKLPEVDGLMMLGFLHPDERLYGVIYDHEGNEPGFDIHCSFDDGGSLSVTNAALPEMAGERPGHRTVGAEVSRAGELFEVLQKELPRKMRKPVSDMTFSVFFQEEYAKAMNWRLKQSGVTREEILEQAGKEGRNLSHAELERAYFDFRQSYIGEIGQACVVQYLDQSGVPCGEIEQRGSNLFAVPEILDRHELSSLLDAAVGLDEEQRREIGKITAEGEGIAIDQWRRIRDKIPLGLEEVGEVREPVRAVIVAVPGTD